MAKRKGYAHSKAKSPTFRWIAGQNRIEGPVASKVVAVEGPTARQQDHVRVVLNGSEFTAYYH